MCLVSCGSASWSCHPFASVFCSYMKGKQLFPSSFSLFFHLTFPRGAGQSWEINRNKLSALQAEPERGSGRRRSERQTEWRRDGAGQVESCKWELIWQLEAAHMANHQHRFEIGYWNILLRNTCHYHTWKKTGAQHIHSKVTTRPRKHTSLLDWDSTDQITADNANLIALSEHVGQTDRLDSGLQSEVGH